MEADSGTPDCMHIAFQSHCRLHDKLYLFIYLLEEQSMYISDNRSKMDEISRACHCPEPDWTDQD